MRSPIVTCCIALASIALLALASTAAAAPPTVTTGLASEMTEDSVTLNGTVNPNGLKTTYYFEYGKTTSYGTKTSEGSLEGSGNKSVSKGLSGLTFGVLYHYRLVATNSGGTTKGADKVFTLRWAIQSLPNPEEEGSLSGVSCTSTSACVAVRETNGPAAVSWNGTEWKAQSVPAEVGGLADVSCTSSTACVAVEREATLSVHWNGTEWKTQKMPKPTGTYVLGTISCTSSTACTAVGENYEGGEGKPLIERWNGTEWKLQSVPSPEASSGALLRGVSCTSSTECTAAGFYYYSAPSTYRGWAARWNGTEWKLQTVPFPETGNRYLESVSCTSSTNCIAVGFDFINGAEKLTYTTLAVHWNGTEWKVKSTPNPEVSGELFLSGVSCTSANACIATGSYSSASGHKTLPLRWTGTEWLLQSAPEPVGSLHEYIYDVSCTFSTACTTVGDYRISGGEFVPLALRYFKTAASPTVTTKSATGITETGATLQGTVNPNGPPAEYHFEYGTTTSYGSSTETVSAGSGESAVEVSKEISGLKPSTEYHYRIVASNENPKASYGSDSTFTTLGPPIVATESAEPNFETGESAKLNATINPRGFSTTYQFEYGTSEGSYSTKVPASPKSIGSGTTNQGVSETITGLTPGTRYYYRATASNSAGTTNGKERSFVAPDTPEAITLEATEVSDTSALLRGKLITHGSGVKYRFEYGTTKAYGLEVPYPAGEAEPTPEETIVEEEALELEPSTTYHYRIVAESPLGNAYGEDETFTTLEVQVPTVLCTTHESETCESPVETFTMSLAEGTSWTLLAGLYTILCLNVSSTIEPLKLGGPQVIHTSELSFTGCGTSSGHSNCSMSVKELPLLTLLRTELDVGVLTAQIGMLRLQCANLGIDCQYNLAGLELEVIGGNPMELISVEASLEEIGGKFLCPGEALLDSTMVSSQELHVLK